MDHTYAVFVGHVAAGRRMSRQAVEGVASGRVWTGSEARRIGLVDDLGGLDRALEMARSEARIGVGETVGVDFYPPPASWLEIFFAKREPRLPGALAAVVKGLETHPPRLLELPPELARLSQPFYPETIDGKTFATLAPILCEKGLAGRFRCAMMVPVVVI
jgi:ClpP class serine protease